MVTWDVQVNRGKTEILVLKPGGRSKYEVRRRNEAPEVRYIVGWLLEVATDFVDTRRGLPTF